MRPIRTLAIRSLAVVVLLGVGSSAGARAEQAAAVLDRAVADFAAGRVTESVAEFDALVRVAPESAAFLWQRGIALYYAGRYADCRAQFESHRTVNPNDVENAAWHFLCVARAESPERARAALLPVGPDERVAMRDIYEMFRGVRTPDAVLAAAGPSAAARFYVHLYVGLYLEAIGNRSQALEHIRIASDNQYATVGGYMHTVARVHLGLRQ